MAKNGGAYFPIHAGFCRDRAARRLRRSHGWEGVGQYVGLLCMLLEEPGNALDVMADADMADLADELGCESAADCADLLRDMASSGMIDAASLGSGIVRAPMVDEAIKTCEEATARAREGGGEAVTARPEAVGRPVEISRGFPGPPVPHVPDVPQGAKTPQGGIDPGAMIGAAPGPGAPTGRLLGGGRVTQDAPPPTGRAHHRAPAPCLSAPGVFIYISD